MCGRFAQPLDIHLIQSQLEEMNTPSVSDVDKSRDVHHQYNISPTNSTPIYFTSLSEKSTFNLKFMRWGVIPSWINTWDDVKKCKLSTFNTRMENMKGKLWSHCERCIIPISGYFEWKEKKMPYYVHGKNKLMLLAGVYSKTEVNDKDIYSFSVVTTVADKELAWLHNRMPLIIKPEEIEKWLKKEEVSAATENLDWFKVDPSVGNTKLDEEKFVKPMKEHNIANFFSKNHKKEPEHKKEKLHAVKREHDDEFEDKKVKRERIE